MANKLTSILAHESIKPSKESLYIKIKSALKVIEKGTFREIATECNMKDQQIWKRLSELERLGKIEFEEIPNFNGRYLISKCSLIFDTKNNRFIHPHLSGVERRNYHQVTLYLGSLKFTKRVHSLMAMTFLNHYYGNRKIIVDHIDNDPLNNKLENLQIITMKENCSKDKKLTIKL